MKTIFIKGITHYKKYVRKALLKSKLIEGRDFIEGYAGNDHALYWLREDLSLKDFKLSIGAKYVWRHRIRFFETIEEMNKKVENTEQSLEEKDLWKRIKESYELTI